MGALAGLEVVVTRAANDAESLGDALRAAGAEPIFFPCIKRLPPENLEAVHEHWGRVSDFDRVIVGSVAALAVFARLPPPSNKASVVAVGDRTAARIQEDRALADRFQVKEVAQAQRAEGIVATVVGALGVEGRLPGRNFLVPRAPEGRTVVQTQLRALGARVEVVETYRIGCGAPLPDPSELAGKKIFTFLSGRTLECFLHRVGPRAMDLLAASVVAVIGPVAREKAEALGVRVDVVPAAPSAEALVQALAAKVGLAGES